MNRLDHFFILNSISGFADFSEIYEEQINIWALENDTGRIERCVETSDWGASLRSFREGNIYFTATNFEKEKQLVANHIGILGNEEHGNVVDFYYERKLDKDFVYSRSFKEYFNITNDIYKRLKSDVPELLNVKISFQRYDKAFTVTNTLGNSSYSDIKGERFSIHMTIGVDNEKFTVYESIGYTFREISQHEIENLSTTCITRANLLKTAKTAPAGLFPCILSSEAGGTLIHEAVGHGLEADLVDKGVSIYNNRLGDEVASKLVTVVDDGTFTNGYGSFLIDDEGTPANRTILIENGVLKNYLYDNFYALKHKVKSTGNGRRQGYAFKPFPRMTNTFILPNKDDATSLLKSIDAGVFVKKMGGGQVNTLTGDFIFEILEGYWIEKGELAYPLKNLSIMGNGPKILMEIDGVATDFGTAIGTCGKEGQGVPVGDGQPTIRIPQLTIGGKS